MKLKKIRKKVNKCACKYGTTDKKSIEIGKAIDEITIKQMQEDWYVQKDDMYQKSLNDLVHVTIQLERFPTTEQWNNYAMENNCYTSISLEYISGESWNRLRSITYKKINEMVKQRKSNEKKV